MRKTDNFKWWQILILILFIIGSIIFTIWLYISIDKYAYKRAVDNPPTDNYIEEVTEGRLLSTALYIYDKEFECEDFIIYYIENVEYGCCYKVAYTITKHFNMLTPYYCWDYCSSVYIGIREEV
jgi:hypothetical protein